MNTAQLNALSRRVIGAAIEVHRELGPGLEEPDYELALCTELSALNIRHNHQHPLPVVYKGVRLDAGYRMDLLVEGALVLEIKSVEVVHPIHEAQLLTYLRLSGRQLGLLLNFDVPRLTEGIRRKVYRLEEAGVEFVDTKDAGQPTEAVSAFDVLSNTVLAAAIEVHRHLGPGLLRSAYEECLCHELSCRGLRFQRQKPIAVRFREIDLPKPVEVDAIVADELPLMLVSVAEISPLLEARLISQLKLGGWEHGLLLNFSAQTLAAGIRRIVNPKLWRNSRSLAHG